MSDIYHAGEHELQERAGTRQQAQAVGRIVESRISPAVARFLQSQSMAVASTVEGGGRVWASLLGGPAGFIEAVDAELVRVGGGPAPGDPLTANLAARPELGLLVMDPSTRQRMRLNGRGRVEPEGIFLLVEQAYGNCPKYIRQRTLRHSGEGPEPGPPLASEGLDARQQEWIRGADTLFIASMHPAAGADASHRGGPPGFVRVLGPDALELDDYAGNGMFNTLGNLVAYPRAGLLFADFAQGHLLQVSGRARVKADFSVRLAIAAVRETAHGSVLRSRPGPGGISTTAAAAGRARRTG